MFVIQKFTTNLTFQGSSLIGELISIIFNFGEREEVFYWIIRNITYFMFGSTANNIFFFHIIYNRVIPYNNLIILSQLK